MAVSAPTGSIRVALDPAAVTFPDLVASLGILAEDSDVTWILEDAPTAWKGASSVWSPQGQATAVMQAIKHQFDPAGILNRGRLFV